ncbi:MAG: hypothetical protein QG619_503 [Pseudomonadota bacterium]|nr:hypothetical protein [Pseudomonadota bacterium]
MDQGGVLLTVGWAGEQIVSARVDCRRPQAAKLLEGRPVAEAVALAPKLFSLCGCAQGAAARLAAAAAQGERLAVDSLCREVAQEAIGEHLWRLLLDWPPLLGLASGKDEFLHWRKRLLSAKTQQDSEAVAHDLIRWLPSLDDFSVSERAVLAPAQLLPWRDAAAWAASGITSAFAVAPVLAGSPAETGALARRSALPAVAALLADGRRVAARLAARRADVEFLAQGLLEPSLLAGWLDSAPAGEGVGLARVETARGLLLHLMQVKDGRVEAYVIVAPTEWNFHPQGAFVGELVGKNAATRERAAALAGHLALALDPCVNYEVRVEDA